VTFSITGLPSSFRAPFIAAEIILGQGASNAPSGARSACYVGPRLASGATAVSGTTYEIGSEQEAAAYFGAGSPLHRAIRKHILANPGGKVYGNSHLPSSGGSPAYANEDFVITGPATATGQAAVYVCGEEISFGWVSGDTATNIGDVLEAKINALTHLPVTASNSSGTVTVTAKIYGASQNDVHRIRVSSVTSGTGVGVTATAALLTGGVDGTTTELSLFTTALTTIAAVRYYYVGATTNVSGFVSALKTHIASKSEPNPGLTSVGLVAFTGSLSSAQTLAIAQNHERINLVWQRNSDHSPDELLGNYLAIRQKREAVMSRWNFDNYGGSFGDWFIKAAPTQSDWPDLDDQNDAITDGVTPICSTPTGSYVAMSVSTRSKDATGLLDDWRASDTHRVSVLDEVADTVKLNHALTYQNFAQMDNPTLADGSTDVNALVPPLVLVPYRYKSWFLGQLDQFFDGRLQKPSEWAAATICRIDPQNVGRMQVKTAGRVVDLAHQVSFRISETTPN
jgi:phage tail sheath gpL-like